MLKEKGNKRGTSDRQQTNKRDERTVGISEGQDKQTEK